MKNIYLLTLLLFSFIGVTAQTMPIISDAPVDGKWADNTTWYYILNGTGTYLDDTHHFNSNTPVLMLNVSDKPTTDKGVWCIVGDDTNGYRLYNKASGKYLATMNQSLGYGGWCYTSLTDGNDTKYVRDRFKFQASEATLEGTDWWCLKDAQTTNRNRWLCRNNVQSYFNRQHKDKVAYYDDDKALDDAESAFMFIIAPIPITDASKLSNELCYTVVTHENGAWCVTADGLDHVGESNPNDYPAQRFAFISNDGGKTHYLYNVGYKKFISKENTLTDFPIDPINLMHPGMVEKTLVPYFDRSHFINIDSINNVRFDGWGPGGTDPSGCADGGNSCYIIPYSEFNPTEALAAFSIIETNMTMLISEAENTLAHFGAGYPKEHSLARTSLQAAIDSAKAHSSSPLFYVHLENTLNEYVLSTDIQMPEDGKAYMITNVQKNGKEYYMRYTRSEVNFGIYLSEAEKFVCHQLNNGKYVFVNDEGKYLIWRGNGTEGTNFVGFMDAYDHDSLSYTDIKVEKLVQNSNMNADNRQLLGLFTLYSRRNDATYSYLTINNDGSYAQIDTLCFNDNYSAGFKLVEVDYDNNFTLKEATGIDDINAIATFSAPYATVVPAEVTAWFVEQNKQVYDGVISLTPIEAGQAIPANTGVILTGNVGTYKFMPAGNETEAIATNNILKGTGGTSVEVPIEENAYIIGKVNDMVGFYPLSTGNRTIEKYKAYLTWPVNLESVKLRLDFNNNVTAIDHVVTRPSVTESIYDLSGRRVMKTIKGQLYICNGKKFIAE